MKSKMPKTTKRHLHKIGDMQSHQMLSTLLPRKQLASLKRKRRSSCFLGNRVDAKHLATLRF